MTEVRITSATGGQKGQKPCRLGAIDPLALVELGNVGGMGEEKYDRFNYLKGYAWSLNVDAAFRHLLAFLSGEDRDPESGFLHTAHAMWHMGALTSFQLRGIGTDDRAPVNEVDCCDFACYEDPGCMCGGCIGQRDPEPEYDDWTPVGDCPCDSCVMYAAFRDKYEPVVEPWGRGDGTVYEIPSEQWLTYGLKKTYG